MSKDDIKLVTLKSIQTESSVYESLIFLTEWSNGDGFDLQITSKHGCIQNISITFDEFYQIKKAVKKLDSL